MKPAVDTFKESQQNGSSALSKWLHAVSVGEVSLLGPVIMRLEQQHPQWTCVISTTTATGYRVARQKLVIEHRGAADRTCRLLGKLVALALLACSANLPAQTPGQIDSAPRAERPAGQLAAEKSGPSDFDNLVTRILLDNLPHEIVQDKDWGQTRQIWDGVRMRWEGTRLDTRRRWKTVNHGTWKRYEIRLIDPQQRFQVQVATPRALEDGRVGFQAQVDAALEVFGRVAQWELGVQLFSISARATAVVRLRIDCSMAMKLDPSRFPPDVRFEPQVTSADLQLIQFRLQRISRAGGPLVHELSSVVRDVLDSKIADRRHQMVDRINRQIEKHQDNLRLSVHDLLASKWGDLAAKQLNSTADEAP